MIRELELEEALVLVKQLLGRGELNEAQRAVFRGVWSRQSYQEIIDAAAEHGYYYSLGHLKNTGSELWQALSDRLGERVTKHNLHEVLAHYRHSRNGSETLPRHQDWGDAPDAAVFYGRTEELATLRHWVTQDQCRVVAILGMGGMGKTSLAVKLAKQSQDAFQSVIWRSLLNAPPVEGTLKEILQFLSHQQEVDFPATLEGQVARVLHYLRQHRCLLILDNGESILQSGSSAGAYRPGYEGYGYVIQRIGEAEHLSCLMITSREKPREVALLEGVTMPVRTLALSGLSLDEGQIIFSRKGCFGASHQDVQKIVNHYAGNPLALNMVASGIQELFDGNVADLMPYLRHGWLRFEDINDALERQFARLSAAEQEVMYWLAINREPVALIELEGDVVSETVRRQLLEALQSIRRRCLVERSDKKWFLQPVVMEYITGRLVAQLSDEIVHQRREVLRSHALLKAQGKDYIRRMQHRLILQPLMDRLIMQLGSQAAVEQHLRKMLARLREDAPLQPGYVAGNLLNLFCELGADLTRLDCSHLAIWQGYFVGVNLRQVDFFKADFFKSVFTETLSLPDAVTFSPNGRLLASAGGDGEVRIWRVADGSRLFTCKGHRSWVWSVSFSPNGRLLASGSSDHLIKLWDTQTGECIQTLKGHSGWVWSVRFNADGQTLISGGSDHSIKLWDVQTGECLKTLQGHAGGVWSALLNQDGQTIASCSEDKTIKLWRVDTGDCVATLDAHQSVVFSLDISSDDQHLVSGSEDGTIKIWDARTGQLLRTLQGHTNSVLAVGFSPDGQTVVSSGSDCTVRAWQTATGQCLKIFQGHSARVFSVAFNPDGRVIASSSDDQTLRLWNAQSGECLRVFQGYGAGVKSVGFSPDGRYLVSGGEDKTIRLWDSKRKRLLKTFQEHSSWVISLAFSPDGHRIASGSDDRTVKIWDVKTGKCLHTLLHSSLVFSVAFSPNGELLASASSREVVQIWDIYTGKLLRLLRGHASRVWSVAFSPIESLLASGEHDQTIRLWDPTTGTCLRVLHGHAGIVFSVAFSPTENILASASDDKTVRIWNVQTGECLHVLTGHTSIVLTVAFSPDGKLIASGSQDHTIRIWDTQSGQCLRTLDKHHNAVYGIAFSPKGNILASGSNDETVKLWDLASYECIEELRGERPYEQMKITGATGLTKAQKDTLKALGAVEADLH